MPCLLLRQSSWLGSLGRTNVLCPLGCADHPFTFTCVSFCPQGNDVRIILGQFDQHMAAKVFCCVSKTLILSFGSLGKFRKPFLGLILTGWSVSEVLGLEFGLLDAQVLFLLLFLLYRELNSLRAQHYVVVGGTKDLSLSNPLSDLLSKPCLLIPSPLVSAMLDGGLLYALRRGRQQIPGQD